MKKSLATFLKLIGSGGLLLSAFPSSTNYQLPQYSFGAGGSANSVSSHYASQGIVGETDGTQLNGSHYNLGAGLIFTEEANVPPAPTFTNPSSYYNKLSYIVNTGGNASDAVFAIAISSDNFATTNYVQADGTVGATAVYQTYAVWGGASGGLVIGLTPGTTYKMKVKAIHGKYTASGFGPVASAATSSPTFTLNITTDNQPSPPFSISFGQLTANTVTDSPHKILTDFSTNANSGATIFVSDQNAGLKSGLTSHTISSATADLGSAPEGYGAQNTAVSQSSGGPATVSSPYNGSSQNVGILDGSFRQLYASGGPITGGHGELLLKAKITSLTPASNDYSDVVTVIGSGNF
ncbi:hypothetical protein KGQ71_01065 [Patescibacteria group bacterium]|nr:hypothetical protein [Patescibacteria group bacterium]